MFEIEESAEFKVLEENFGHDGFQIIIDSILYKVQVNQDDKALIYFTIDIQWII